MHPPTSNTSNVIPCDDYRWEGVERKDYKTDTANFRSIHRYSLLGEEYEPLSAHTRYFEIQPGGYSSLERHQHPHSVVVIRGGGSVILDNALHPIGLHDVVYIAPYSIHQFHADRGETLGFICVVDRDRDRPRIPAAEEVAEVITDPEVLARIRR